VRVKYSTGYRGSEKGDENGCYDKFINSVFKFLPISFNHQIIHSGKWEFSACRTESQLGRCCATCLAYAQLQSRARTRRDPSGFISLHQKPQGHSRTLRPVHTFSRDMANRHIPRPSHATPRLNRDGRYLHIILCAMLHTLM
jgi:hypothetical protein